jgi:hypothetical protein
MRSARHYVPAWEILLGQHGGVMTPDVALRTAALWAGPGSALGGLTAARLAGFTGLQDDDEPVFVIRPPGRVLRGRLPPLRIEVHYSRHLGADAIEPGSCPRRTLSARSLVDAASWHLTDKGAREILMAGVRQGIVTPEDLATELSRRKPLNRRLLMIGAVADIGGKVHAS